LGTGPAAQWRIELNPIGTAPQQRQRDRWLQPGS
jgi:hypothetical protein